MWWKILLVLFIIIGFLVLAANRAGSLSDYRISKMRKKKSAEVAWDCNGNCKECSESDYCFFSEVQKNEV